MSDDNEQSGLPTRSAYATVLLDDGNTTEPSTKSFKMEEKDLDSKDHDPFPEIRSLEPGNEPVYLLQEDLNLPLLCRVTTWLYGFEVLGVPWSPGRRCRHITVSIFLFVGFVLVFWLMNSFAFGYSDSAAIAISASMLAGCVFVNIPLEQLTWANPMMLTYFRDSKQKVADANHNAPLLQGGSFVFFILCLPLIVWVIPALVAEDADKRFTKGEIIAMWIGVLSSFILVPFSAGWGPLAEVFVSKYPKYVSSDLVNSYTNSVLTTLVDETSSVSSRRQRLGILYHRQGKHIRSALVSFNKVTILGLPFMLMWGMLGLIWLIPDIVGGLPNAEKSLSGGDPSLRIILGVALLAQTLWHISWSSMSSMARPHTLFEERIRHIIAPDAPKLHTAIQLFPLDGEKGLWNFLKSQGIYLSLYGVPIDSSLPARVAPLITSLFGALAFALARSY